MQLPFGKADLTLASRFECKYVVDPEITPQIRQFLHAFAEPDPYAARCPGNRYPICSLYLDSPDMRLYQQTVGGDKNRFKLRVRTYSDAPDTPTFFEVKRKFNSIVSKRRAVADRKTAASWLSFPTAPFIGAGSDHEGLDFFESHRRLTHARPLIKVRYMREAYQSRGGDPVRVTIDTDLAHQPAFGPDLSMEEGRWTQTPLSGDIVEIKYTELRPPWLTELVRAFAMKQRPVPKYVLSIDHMLSGGRRQTISVGGMTLPPLREFG